MRQRYDDRYTNNPPVESPRADAFIRELIALCERTGLSIGGDNPVNLVVFEYGTHARKDYEEAMTAVD